MRDQTDVGIVHQGAALLTPDNHTSQNIHLVLLGYRPPQRVRCGGIFLFIFLILLYLS